MNPFLRALSTLACLSALLATNACERTPKPPAAAVTSTVETDALTLTLTVSDTEITTVDRIEVALTASVPSDTPLPELEPGFPNALESSGWTVVATVTAPPSFDGTRLVQTTAVTIEPYLPGDYAVPGFSLDTAAASLEPIPVAVASVLPEGDPLDQSPELAELREPPPFPETTDTAVIAVTVTLAVILIAVIAAVVIARLRASPPAETAADRLRRAERTAAKIADAWEVTPADLDTLDRAVRTAADVAAPDPALTTQLIDDLERARFTPTPPPDGERSALATRAEAFVRTAHETFLVEHRRGGAHP